MLGGTWPPSNFCPYNSAMVANPEIFDVYLTGAKDKSPSVQMRLVAIVAARYRLSAPVVAEALEGVPHLVASRLPRREAQAMVEVLDEMGVLARLSPTGAPLGREAPLVRPPAAVAPAAKAQLARRPDDNLAPPRPKDHRITLRSAEVATALVVDVSEPIEFAEAGPEGKTGVRGSDTLRCPIHGLMYNRRKASGCVRCLAGARVQARKLRQEQAHPFSEGSGAAANSLRDNPVRRAFWGLAVALLLGFIPAVYYARAINHRALLGLRAQQAALSSAPATQESLARFDELSEAVDQAHRRGAGRTLLIWFAAAGLSGLAWGRLTRPSGLSESS